MRGGLEKHEGKEYKRTPRPLKLRQNIWGRTRPIGLKKVRSDVSSPGGQKLPIKGIRVAGGKVIHKKTREGSRHLI